jgi:hypothetical protein
MTIAMLLAFASAAHADLKYTTHVEVRATPVPGSSDASLAAVGSMLRALVPAGDARTFVNAESARVETQGPGAAVTLMRPDGHLVIDAATRTYWRMPSATMPTLNSSARPSYNRTGEFATILGIRAERIVFTLSLPLPVSPPAGFQAAMTFEGELWLSDAYPAYARTVGQTTQVQPALFRDLPDGMVLRHILRNPQLGYEVEYVVTELVEEAIPDALFGVPAEYREVPAPLRMAIPPLGR